MKKSILKKAIVLGICSTLLTPGAVFASGQINDSTISSVDKLTIANQALKSQIAVDKTPNQIGVLLDGEWVPMKAKPFIEKFRTMVPVRDLVESFGAEIKWYEKQQVVAIISDSFFMELVVGKADAKVILINDENLIGETINIEVPVKIVNGHIFVPGRFIAEAFGADVDWDKSLNAMVITTEEENDGSDEETGELNSSEMVKKVVEEFGTKLQLVSLLSPKEVLIQSLEEHYSGYVTKELLEEWKANPETAPGRLVSSPWPARIDILNVTEISDTEFTIEGEIIEITSEDQNNVAGKISVTLQVVKVDNQWLISNVELGEDQ